MSIDRVEIARLLARQRVRNARLYTAIRLAGYSVWLALETWEALYARSRGTPGPEPVELAVVGGSAVFAAAMFWGVRRSRAFAEGSWLALALFDAPIVIAVQALSDVHSLNHLATELLGMPGLVIVIVGAVFSLRRRMIFFAAASSVVLEAMLLRGQVIPIVFSSFSLVVVGIAGVFLISLLERLIEVGARERVGRQRLDRYFSPSVREAIHRRGEETVSGELRDVTVLFADIRGFTEMSTRMPPGEIVQMLNAYFTAVVAVVFEHGGTLDKFIGDGLLAYFGAPIAQPDHAASAVRCAIRMMEALAVFNEARAKQGHAPIQIGVGVHSGPAVVGDVGSPDRREYTAIGETVNIASRVEGLTKELERPIVVTASTRNAAGDAFDWTALPKRTVKGVREALDLYAPAAASAPARTASGSE
jgi:adenylate cyclase